jgi:hypothetical protein
MCAAPGNLDQHFEHTSRQVRATFNAVLAAVSGLGRVQVLAEKTRIALHVRMSFAAFIPRRRWHPLASALLIHASDTTRASFSGARSLTETRRPAHKDHSGAAWKGSAGQPGWRHNGGSVRVLPRFPRRSA